MMIATDLDLKDLLPDNRSARSHACYSYVAFDYGDPRHCGNPQAAVLINVGNGFLRPLCPPCAGELAVRVASAIVFLRENRIS